MIIILKPSATKEDADEIIERIDSVGLKPLYMPGTERTVIGAIGDERVLGGLHLESHPLVERITPILTPYKLVSRDVHPDDTVVKIDGVPVGGKRFMVIAGPCAVENREQLLATAKAVKEAGAHCL
ncbi:MAG: 3-deoxy-7-phosphoheptulonate synthase, partial [Chloroflexi bacterium]|nr:3-deoxy-7-phosphoheptulonate synthase [Chloroflexota bacterium]